MLGITLGLLSNVLLPLPASESTPPPKRVLVYTVSAGFEHDVVKRAKPDEPSLVERTLVELGKQRKWFECVLSRDAADFTREKLANFDLVFFYTTGELPFTAENQRALFDFVKDGKAFAGAHSATDTFYRVPEYGEMIGAYFDGHPWHENVRVLVDDREHPSTRHLGAGFEIVDEIYQMKAPYERAKLHVLLHLDPDALDLKKPGINRTDRDFANAWTKDFGKGRVFYTAFGHRPEVWADERFSKHLEGGFAWAMRAEKEAGFIVEPASPAPERKKPGDEPNKQEEKAGGAPTSGSAARSVPNQALTLAAPSGFAVDLVAQSPEILWPTAVTCLDDGTLLVGEDRMDMPGPTDQPVDRLIALHFQPDGSTTKTVFAERLNAVMGLELVDGDVFVMNMPYLTRLRDVNGDGVADERKEVLTTLGPNAPGHPGGFNDHIVSGIRLGLDGFLYVAVGDKGIPRAIGTDGRELTLRGGGVVRVRPDGSRLEIVASGLRNVLDVAIDARGEMFTYDNTDDGLGWWTRLTHVVNGGYYGYPWDYKEHPERFLPCMADYGGGSPCGGLVYREAAWPEELRGNLFYCEWGRGSLRRFVLEAKGTTFGVKTAEDFVTAGDVPHFKPFDVCESPDGRFLYVSDWAYEGWQADQQAGRIWRVRRDDDDPRVQSRMQPLPADVTSLGEVLNEPSYRRRSAAQRALTAAGALDVTKPIAASSRWSAAQPHAIWAVAESWSRSEAWALDPDSQPHSTEAWIQLLRAELVFPERVSNSLSRLLLQMNARLGPDLALAVAASCLREMPEPAGARAKERHGIGALFRTLAIPPGSGSWERKRIWSAFARSGLAPQVTDKAEKHADEFLASLRDRCEPAVVRMLEDAWNDPSETVTRAALLDVLASCARKEAPWDGTWWNIQPAKTPRPARVVDWEGTPRILDRIRSALRDIDVEVRRVALRAVSELPDRAALPEVRERALRDSDASIRMLALDVLGRLKDEGAAPTLASVIRDGRLDEKVRGRAVEAACAIRSAAMIELLRSVAADDAAAPAQSVACIEALARLGDGGCVADLERRIGAGDASVRCAAIAALAKLRGPNGCGVISAQLRASEVDVRRAACRALGSIGDAAHVPALLAAASDADTSAEATLALAQHPDPRALDVFLSGVRSSEKRVVDASHAGLLAIRDEVRVRLEELQREGKLDETQLAAAQKALRAPRPIVEWKLLGPFVRKTKPSVASSGASIDPRNPTAAKKLLDRDGREARWTDARADANTGGLDLRRRFDGFDHSSAFATAIVVSSHARRAQMLVGSDDGIEIWLNGARVHSFDGDRAWTPDEDELEVDLVEGSNLLLARIDNSGGGWEFGVKIEGDESGALFERAAAIPGVDDYRAYALAHPGDPQSGYRLFRMTSGPMCIRCHTVNGEGAQVGPDLSDIAARYGRDEILTSILQPSQRIAEGYNAVAFELDSGRVVFGQIKRETGDAVEIHDVNGEARKLEKSEIVERSISKTSVMPEGLAALMSKEDFADLVAYVLTLRGAGK